MKILVDISPINPANKSEHRVRGVGKYITLLYDNLEKYDQKNTYIFSSNPDNKDADLIHFPYFDPFFISLPLKKHKKTIVTVHDLIPIMHKTYFPSGIKGDLKWKVNKQLLKRVDAVIADSEASKEDINKLTGISKNKIFTVYLAAENDYKKLDLSDEEKIKLRNKLNLPDKYILYVGDVTWNKNLPRLVKAIEKVKIPLVMVGKALKETDFDATNRWNNDRKIVYELTEDSPLFIKLGFVSNEDLNTIYNLAELLCMPSLDEGFGLPALEAMQAGCPVVLSHLGSLPEVGGEAAVYVDAENIDDISDKISKVATSKELQNSMAAKGLEQSKKFTLENFIQQTVKVYEKFRI